MIKKDCTWNIEKRPERSYKKNEREVFYEEIRRIRTGYNSNWIFYKEKKGNLIRQGKFWNIHDAEEASIKKGMRRQKKWSEGHNFWSKTKGRTMENENKRAILRQV